MRVCWWHLGRLRIGGCPDEGKESHVSFRPCSGACHWKSRTNWTEAKIGIYGLKWCKSLGLVLGLSLTASACGGLLSNRVGLCQFRRLTEMILRACNTNGPGAPFPNISCAVPILGLVSLHPNRCLIVRLLSASVFRGPDIWLALFRKTGYGLRRWFLKGNVRVVNAG